MLITAAHIKRLFSAWANKLRIRSRRPVARDTRSLVGISERLERRAVLSGSPSVLAEFPETEILASLYHESQQAFYLQMSDGRLLRSDNSFAQIEEVLPAETHPYRLTAIGDDLLFLTTDGVSQTVWSTDGSQTSTMKLGEVPQIASIDAIVGQGDSLYLATAPLWSISPTSSEPVAGAPLRRAADLVPIGDTLLFRVDAFTRQQAWITDGEDTSELLPVQGPTVDHIVADEDMAWISTTSQNQAQLWAYDGNDRSIRSVKSFLPNSLGPPRRLSDKVLFLAGDDGSGSASVTLWQSDGTANGTQPIVDLTPDQEDGLTVAFLKSTHAQTVGNLLYFSDTTNGIWVTDGTATGTHQVREGSQVAPLARQFLPGLDDTFFFLDGSRRTGPIDLWQSDGTTNGTEVLWSADKPPRGIHVTDDAIYVATSHNISRIDVGVTLSGTVWQDEDRNGERTELEPGWSGVTVEFVNGEGRTLRRATTDATGTYQATLPRGEYRLRLVVPDSASLGPLSADNRFHPADGMTEQFHVVADTSNLDAALQRTSTSLSMQGSSWHDENWNGQPDVNELPQGGGRATLLDSFEQTIASTTIGPDGRFVFDGLTAGEYRLQIDPPPGFVRTPSNAIASEPSQWLPVNRTTGRTHLIRVSSENASGPIQVRSGVIAESLLPRSRYEVDSDSSVNNDLRQYLRITEIAVDPARGFIEFHNTGDRPLNLHNVRFLDGIAFDFTHSSLEYLFPAEYGLIVANHSAFAAKYETDDLLIAGEYVGRMRDEGESLEMSAPINDRIQRFSFQTEDWYPQLRSHDFTLTLRDAFLTLDAHSSDQWSRMDAWRLSERQGGSPGYGDSERFPPYAVLINEVLTNPAGGTNDWIELRNTTSAPIDLSGWFLGDDEGDQPLTERYRIPEGTVIPANGYVVLTRAEHFGFGLSSFGETLHLMAADAEGPLGYVHHVQFGAAIFDQAYGWDAAFLTRERGYDRLWPLRSSTAGGPNVAATLGPVVVTEIMDHPAFQQDIFIELTNRTHESVLVGASINAYTSVRVLLGPHQTYLLVDIDADTFRARYQIPDHVGVTEFTFGRLEAFLWSRTLAVDVEYADNRYMLSDLVTLSEEPPWPVANHGGSSLERELDPFRRGSDPLSWRITSQLGGTPGDFRLPAGDVNGDGVFDSTDLVLVFQAGEYEDDVPGNSSFVEGDWDQDGDFTTGDLVLAFQSGYVSEAAAARFLLSTVKLDSSSWSNRGMRNGKGVPYIA